MKYLMLAILFCTTAFAGNVQQLNLKIDTASFREALEFNDQFKSRMYKGYKIHKAFAYTTGGLLLLSDAVGAYHFFSMRKQGHDYRDNIGFSEDAGDENLRTNEIKDVWESSTSQGERVLHSTLISLSTICYVTTATIELTLPRMDSDTSRFSHPNIHRSLFYCHAALMLANIGLGFAESYALSKGNHDLVEGLGITHVVVGIAAPIVIIGSGMVFKF